MVSEIISRVTETSRRQVMLQATVVEIALNNNYQQGIDWSVFNAASTGPRFIQSETASWGNVLQNRSFDAINQRRAELEQYYGLSRMQETMTIPANYVTGDPRVVVTPGTPAVTRVIQPGASGGIFNMTLTTRFGGALPTVTWRQRRTEDIEIYNPDYIDFQRTNTIALPDGSFPANPYDQFVTVPGDFFIGGPPVTVNTPATPASTTTLDFKVGALSSIFNMMNSPLIDADTGMEIPASFWNAARPGAVNVRNPLYEQTQSMIEGMLQAFIDNGRGLQPSANASSGFLNGTFRFGDLQAAVSLLDRFGDTKVVSSPRVSALNGQGAILKVVEDAIYFQTTTTSETDIDTNTTTDQTSVTQQSVPIGFVCNVYPQIGADGTIILQMRPSVSRVTGYALPPTTGGGVSSGVPIVSVKEIETLMLIQDGQTAVMGGLIEDQTLDQSVGVPGANKLPGLGNFFENKSQQSRRIEYVIFVTAKIIENPSLNGDYREYLDWLPSDETFHRDQTGNIFNNEIDKVSRAK
jgi:Flp pilus assembly secretin CpaC